MERDGCGILATDSQDESDYDERGRFIIHLAPVESVTTRRKRRLGGAIPEDAIVIAEDDPVRGVQSAQNATRPRVSRLSPDGVNEPFDGSNLIQNEKWAAYKDAERNFWSGETAASPVAPSSPGSGSSATAFFDASSYKDFGNRLASSGFNTPSFGYGAALSFQARLSATPSAPQGGLVPAYPRNTYHQPPYSAPSSYIYRNAPNTSANATPPRSSPLTPSSDISDIPVAYHNRILKAFIPHLINPGLLSEPQDAVGPMQNAQTINSAPSTRISFGSGGASPPWSDGDEADDEDDSDGQARFERSPGPELESRWNGDGDPEMSWPPDINPITCYPDSYPTENSNLEIHHVSIPMFTDDPSTLVAPTPTKHSFNKRRKTNTKHRFVPARPEPILGRYLSAHKVGVTTRSAVRGVGVELSEDEKEAEIGCVLDVC